MNPIQLKKEALRALMAYHKATIPFYHFRVWRECERDYEATRNAITRMLCGKP
jgi:hypothetical protein